MDDLVSNGIGVVVLTMMSAGRSSDTVMVMSFSVHAQCWS
jgi:hypothetical protein